MGKCNNCERSISLKEKETTCPKCGQSPYNCWNCKKDIDTSSHECPLCGFFICNECKVCGKDCNLEDTVVKMKEKFIELQPLTNEKVRTIVEEIYLARHNRQMKLCFNNVSISYAKGKLRNIKLKLDGVNVRNNMDKEAFEKRMAIMYQYPLGKSWVVNQVREDGEYGSELRDVSNMMVCIGAAKKRHIQTIKDGKVIKEYDLFERVELPKCKYVANFNELITKRCDGCKEIYNHKQNYCVKCNYKKGKEKGQPRKLVLNISNVDFCQLPRREFKIRGLI